MPFSHDLVAGCAKSELQWDIFEKGRVLTLCIIVMWPWLHHSSHFFGSPESRPGRSLCPPRHLKLGTLRQREWHRPCSAEPRPRFDSRLPIDAHAATQHNSRGAYEPPLEACVHSYQRWPRTTRRASCLSIIPLPTSGCFLHSMVIVLSFRHFV